ncbi:hypothetical protein D3C72_2587670 [compost metagenome]
MTVTFPAVAPAGTVTVSCSEVPSLGTATTPLKLTWLLATSGSKLLPLTVTTVPGKP